MSATPRTDKLAVGIIGFYSCSTVPADFARELETENAVLKVEVLFITAQLDECRQARKGLILGLMAPLS